MTVLSQEQFPLLNNKIHNGREEKKTLIFEQKVLYLIFSLISLRWVAASQRRQHRLCARMCKILLLQGNSTARSHDQGTHPQQPFLSWKCEQTIEVPATLSYSMISSRQGKKKKGKGRKERVKGGRRTKEKSALSPSLFRRLPALCSSFWAELERLPLAQEDPPSQQPSAGRPHWGHFIEVTLLCTT